MNGPGDAAGLLVLVVDDDDRSRELLRLVLRRAGYRVLSAADAQAAVALLATERPSAVIADVMMPGMDGLEFCRWLRRQPALDGVACALLTGLDTREVREQARAAGADALLTKPFDRGELLAELTSTLASRGATSPR
jgi:two-component system alkaline phosphatase synthesis response regulator PhoP